MDSTALIVVVAILALIAVAAFSVYRRRGDLEIKLPFGIEFRFGGSGEEPQARPGVRGRKIRAGKMVRAEDETGRGTDLEDVEAQEDVILTSKTPSQDARPKGEPPA